MDSKALTIDHSMSHTNEQLERERLAAYQKANYHESHLRSVLKGITWRIMGTAITIGTAYYLTGQIKTALTVGTIEFFSKIGLYYAHERAWEQVPKGTIRVLRAKYFGK